MLLAAGLGAFLAALQVLLRDVEHVVQVLVTILFYASPILYPASIIPAALRGWVEVNPLAWFSERMRQVLLQGAGLVPNDAVVALGCVAVFFAGLWVFNRLSPSFEDFL
jgi:lipopolysaccharide transport system permease protein